jgi:serine/threonine protein phosphatase PrpC
MRLRVGAATDIGMVRKLNEDAFAVRAEQGLFVVCDGMGGAAAGEVASRLAVDTVVVQLKGRRPVTGAEPDSDGYMPQTTRLADAVQRANQLIYEQSQTESAQAGMGTTLVAAWIDQNIASVAHVGDSRAYLWRNDRLEALTSDHSLVEAEVRAGLIDREQSLQSEHQNILLRALGREPEIEVEVNEVPVQPGDYVILCSDGLTRMVTDPALADAVARLREPQRICDSLIDAANANGGVDNVTVVVVQAVAGWWTNVLRRSSRKE